MNYEEVYKLIVEGKLAWEYLISEIIREENLNPLDIDISLLTERFMEFTNYMVKVDFHNAGKFVFIASILLRLKSQYLLDTLLGVRNKEYKYNYIKSKPFPIVLPAKINFVRRRPITLSDLLQYIRRVIIARSESREIEFKVKLNQIQLPIKIANMEKILAKLFAKTDKISFKEMERGKEWKEIVEDFISTVFLYAENKIDLYQSAPLEDIIITNKSL